MINALMVYFRSVFFSTIIKLFSSFFLDACFHVAFMSMKYLEFTPVLNVKDMLVYFIFPYRYVIVQSTFIEMSNIFE